MSTCVQSKSLAFTLAPYGIPLYIGTTGDANAIANLFNDDDADTMAKRPVALVMLSERHIYLYLYLYLYSYVLNFKLMKMIFRPLWQQAIVESSWLRTGFSLMSMTPPLITSSTGEKYILRNTFCEIHFKKYILRDTF